MLNTLSLLLPVIIPSWRFFDMIAPSPRIEVAALDAQNEEPKNWQEYRPRPEKLRFVDMLRHMIWNAHWNESLFLMSCAERLMKGEEEFAQAEILKRIKRDLNQGGFVQFRLVFHARDGEAVSTHIVYTSPVEAL